MVRVTCWAAFLVHRMDVRKNAARFSGGSYGFVVSKVGSLTDG